MSVFEYAYGEFEETFHVKLNQHAEQAFNDLTLEFGGEEVIAAIDIVCEQYSDVEDAFRKIKGVLVNRKKFSNMVGEEKERVTLTLPKRIVSELKQYALMTETSLSDMVSELIDKYLEDQSTGE